MLLKVSHTEEKKKNAFLASVGDSNNYLGHRHGSFWWAPHMGVQSSSESTRHEPGVLERTRPAFVTRLHAAFLFPFFFLPSRSGQAPPGTVDLTMYIVMCPTWTRLLDSNSKIGHKPALFGLAAVAPRRPPVRPRGYTGWVHWLHKVDTCKLLCHFEPIISAQFWSAEAHSLGQRAYASIIRHASRPSGCSQSCWSFHRWHTSNFGDIIRK